MRNNACQGAEFLDGSGQNASHSHDLVIFCDHRFGASDASVVCRNMAGCEVTTVPVPNGEDPFAEWLPEAVLQLVTLKPNTHLRLVTVAGEIFWPQADAYGQLRQAGYTVQELLADGFDRGQVCAAGYSAEQLRANGFSAIELHAGGYSATQLLTAGWPDYHLRQAGYSNQELGEAEKDRRVRLSALLALAHLTPAPTRYVEDAITLLHDYEVEVRCTAIRALSTLGHRATPHVAAVAALLNDEELRVRLTVVEAMPELGEVAAPYAMAMAELLHHGQSSIRIASVKALSKLGDAAAPHVAAMAELLHDKHLPDYSETPDVCHAAVEALGNIGKCAAPYVAVLDDLSRNSRFPSISRAAVVALAHLGQFTEVAVLKKFVRSKNPSIQDIGIDALANNGELTVLLGLLHDEDRNIRCKAVMAFAKIGDAGAPHIAAMVKLLRDSDNKVRFATARALPKLGKTVASHAAAAVSTLIHDASEDALELGVAILSGLQESAAVVELFLDEDPSVRCVALSALPRLGAAAAAPHATSVVDLLRDSHEAVRYAAVDTLPKLVASATLHAAPVTKLLYAKEVKVRHDVSEVPPKFGEAVAEHVAASLAELIHDKNQKASCDALRALAILPMLREAAASHTNAVVELFHVNRDFDFCSAARETLPEFGDTVATHAAEAIVKLFRSSDPHVRLVAVMALEKLDEAAALHVPAVVELFHDKDENVCCAAIDAFSTLGVSAVPHIPAVIALLRDANRRVCSVVATALPKFGQAAGLNVAAALAQLLSDKDKAIRTKAAFKVNQIIIPKLGGTMRPLVSAAVTELLRCTDTHTCLIAINAMSVLGEAAAPYAIALVEILCNSDLHIRLRAIEALPKLGEGPERTAIIARLREDRDIRHAVFELINQQNLEVRLRCIQALSKIGVPELLLGFLEDNRWRVRLAALRALSALGHKEAPCIAAMAKLLSDKDMKVRCTAVEALSYLGKAATMHTTTMVTAMVKLLNGIPTAAISERHLDHVPLDKFDEQRDPVSIRLATVEALSKLGKSALPHTAAMVTAMVELLDFDFNYGRRPIFVRLAAVNALTRLGTAAEPHAEAMLKAVIDRCPSDQRLCLVVIKEISKLGFHALTKFGLAAAFVLYLGHEDRRVRLVAFEALSELGCAAAPHIVPISKLLHDKDTDIRCAIVMALPKLGDAVVPYATVVAELVLDKDKSVRRCAIRALSELGEIANVVQLICDKDEKVRVAVVEALFDLLLDDDWNVRISIVQALATLGQTAAPDTAAMVKIFHEKDERFCHITRKTLPVISEAALDVASAVKAIHNEDSVLRKAVSAVVSEFGALTCSDVSR